MEELWRSIAATAIALHPDRLRSLAGRIERATSPEAAEYALSVTGDVPALVDLRNAWRQVPEVPTTTIGAALRAASATAVVLETRQSVEIVWTGPATTAVPVRRTEQALLETIGSARQRLFVVSFVAFKVASVSDALNEAVNRNVSVSILLERARSEGGQVDVDSLEMMRKAVPGALLYAWTDAMLAGGTMHAKCAVADGSLAFVTSANLTRAALERNIELGLLIRGGDVPRDLHRHLDNLVATQKLTPS